MNVKKIYIITLSSLIFLSSCQGIKEGLTGQTKKNSGDEFLVSKKNPLVLPPNFDDLPLPNPEENKKKYGEVNIKDLFGLYESKSEVSNEKNNEPWEKYILKKIHNN